MTSLLQAPAHPTLPQVNIVRDKGIKYLAGSSQDGKTVYIDPSLPHKLVINGKVIDPALSLAVHEIYEREAINELLHDIKDGKYTPKGKTRDQVHDEVYETAHNECGTKAEHNFLVEHYKFTEADWQRYQQIMKEAAARTEKEPGVGASAPPDLYTYMYPAENRLGLHHPKNPNAAKPKLGLPSRGKQKVKGKVDAVQESRR